jgi:hypothetical protein
MINQISPEFQRREEMLFEMGDLLEKVIAPFEKHAALLEAALPPDSPPPVTERPLFIAQHIK